MGAHDTRQHRASAELAGGRGPRHQFHGSSSPARRGGRMLPPTVGGEAVCPPDGLAARDPGGAEPTGQDPGGPQSGALSHAFVRVTGTFPLPSARMTNTSAWPSTPSV